MFFKLHHQHYSVPPKRGFPFISAVCHAHFFIRLQRHLDAFSSFQRLECSQPFASPGRTLDKTCHDLGRAGLVHVACVFFFPDLINRHDLHHTPYGTGTYAYINSFSASQLVAK